MTSYNAATYMQIEISRNIVSPRLYLYLDEVSGNLTNVEKRDKKRWNRFGVGNPMPNVDAKFHCQWQIGTICFQRLGNSIYHVISRLDYRNIPSHSRKITWYQSMLLFKPIALIWSTILSAILTLSRCVWLLHRSIRGECVFIFQDVWATSLWQ